MIRQTMAALAAFALTAPAAHASTLPPLDFQVHQIRLGLGVFDGNLDYALTDRLSAGVTASYPLTLLAGRVTYRLGEASWGAYGLTFGAGLIPAFWAMPASRRPGGSWLQPAACVAVRLGSSPWSLRGTVGPVFLALGNPYYSTIPALWAVPNVELAYRLDPHQELTLGGASLLGWRGTW